MSYKAVRGSRVSTVGTAASAGHTAAAVGSNNLQGVAFYDDGRFDVDKFGGGRQVGQFDVTAFDECWFGGTEPGFQEGRFDLACFDDSRFG